MGEWEDPSAEAEAAAAFGGARPGEADTVKFLRAEGPHSGRFDDAGPGSPGYWEQDAFDETVSPWVIDGSVVKPRTARFSHRRVQDEDPGHRRAMFVWRSAIVTTMALALTLIVLAVVTTINNNSSIKNDEAQQSGGIPTAVGSAPGTAADGTDPMSAGAVTATTRPPQDGTSGAPLDPTAAQQLAAAAPAGSDAGNAPAQTQPRPRSVQPAGSGSTAQPTSSAQRCGPVTALFFLFWTLLGLGPC